MLLIVFTGIEESKEQLLQPCDDHVLTEIVVVTERVSFDLLSSHFEMTFEDVAKIDDEHEENKMLAVLRKWRCRKKENASYFTLIKPFVKMNNIAVVEVIVEHIKKHSINETEHLQHPFTPEATPDKYPSWNDMSHVEREQIKNKLREENEKTNSEYASVVIDILRLFKKRKVEYEEIKIFLQLFVKPMSTSELDKASDLDRADSMNKVFWFISKHTSWFNFEILEEVVKKFGDEEEKKLLSNYISGTLTPYLKRSIFEIPPDSFPSQSNHSVCSLVCLKLPDDLFPSGSDIKLIQLKLAKRIGFNPSNLQLCFYESGCIELNFEIQNVWLSDASTFCKINEIVECSHDKYNVTLDIISIL